MKTKNKCKTKHDPQARHMLERPVANSGPMNQAQIKAMWAKKNNPASVAPPASPPSSAPGWAPPASGTPPITYLPVPVPIPKPQPVIPPGVALPSNPINTQPAPPHDPIQDVWDQINRLRQGLPAVPPAPDPGPRPPMQPLSVTVSRPVNAVPVTPTTPPFQKPKPPLRHGPVPEPTNPPLRHGPVLLKPIPTPVKPVPKSTGATSSFWKGVTPDPALKKKRGGTVNNRFAEAIRFLRNHGAPEP